MIYCYPQLSEKDFYLFRLGGAGLGNILFPWARSVVYAKRTGAIRINATWNTMKFGPLLRGEIDKRLYSGLFDEHEVGGIKKTLILSIGKKLAEDSLVNQDSIRPEIVVFKDMKNMMLDILEHHDIVKNELWKMIKSENMEPLKSYSGNGIAIHIRMGDFQEAKDEKVIREGNWNYRLPLRWYVEMVKKIRVQSGWDVPIYVFSDGHDDDLQPVLSLDNVSRAYFGSAISDMVALSQSKLLIASASTFSMWASYLGQMPVLWFPGSHRQKLYIDGDMFEGEVDYDDDLPLNLQNDLKILFGQASDVH